jgi:hypothetical protein
MIPVPIALAEGAVKAGKTEQLTYGQPAQPQRQKAAAAAV